MQVNARVLQVTSDKCELFCQTDYLSAQSRALTEMGFAGDQVDWICRGDWPIRSSTQRLRELQRYLEAFRSPPHVVDLACIDGPRATPLKEPQFGLLLGILDGAPASRLVLSHFSQEGALVALESVRRESGGLSRTQHLDQVFSLRERRWYYATEAAARAAYLAGKPVRYAIGGYNARWHLACLKQVKSDGRVTVNRATFDADPFGSDLGQQIVPGGDWTEVLSVARKWLK